MEKGDVDALLVYLRRSDDAMRIERAAALKNDVMNLLRNQEPPVEGLAETLIAMIEGRPVAGFGRSGRAGVPPPAADGDGTLSYRRGHVMRLPMERRPYRMAVCEGRCPQIRKA